MHDRGRACKENCMTMMPVTSVCLNVQMVRREINVQRRAVYKRECLEFLPHFMLNPTKFFMISQHIGFKSSLNHTGEGQSRRSAVCTAHKMSSYDVQRPVFKLFHLSGLLD